MPEQKILFKFPECAHCHSKDLVTPAARDMMRTLPPEVFVAGRSEFTPLQNIAALTTPTVRGIFKHFDVCANCGTERCILVEERAIDSRALGLQVQMPRGNSGRQPLTAEAASLSLPGPAG